MFFKKDLTSFQKNTIPAEIATKGENGQIVPYKRQAVSGSTSLPNSFFSIDVFSKDNTIPAEIATKGENGQIVPYKRQAVSVYY